MPVVLARVVAREENLEPGNFDQKHGRAEDVAGGIGRDADRGNSVCGVIVDGFDLGKSGEVVGFGVYLDSLLGR